MFQNGNMLGQGTYIMPNGGVISFGSPSNGPPKNRRRRGGKKNKDKDKDKKPTRWGKLKKSMSTTEGIIWLTFLSPLGAVGWFYVTQMANLVALYSMKQAIQHMEALTQSLL